MCAGSSDGFADVRAFVTAEIVHDDNVTGSQCLQKKLVDIEPESLAIDRAVNNAGRVDPVAS